MAPVLCIANLFDIKTEFWPGLRKNLKEPESAISDDLITKHTASFLKPYRDPVNKCTKSR